MSQQDPPGVGLPPMTDPRIPAPGFSPLPEPAPGPANPDPPTATATASRPGGRHAGDEPWSEATSTPGSTDDGGPPNLPLKSRRALFTKLVETALQAVGGLLNRGLAVDEHDECFLPDQDDTKTIPPPLGDLAARHVDLPIGKDNVTDAQDLIAAGIGLMAWLLKGLVDWAIARREHRKATAGAVAAPADELAAQNGAGQ